MPALPWIDGEPASADEQYLAMASRLPLRSHLAIPGFLRDTLRIRRQLARAPGMIGYGLKADLVAKTFWTYSVWRDEDSMAAFARSEPHATIMKRLRPRMGESRFSTTTVAGDAIPRTWAEMSEPVR
ncbi:MAG: DUF3291 domain-containing protein [Actinomycetota bacterium]|nr:DUF3291 domain-containing protein [Actinomycetota bacterium]